MFSENIYSIRAFPLTTVCVMVGKLEGAHLPVCCDTAAEVWLNFGQLQSSTHTAHQHFWKLGSPLG